MWTEKGVYRTLALTLIIIITGILAYALKDYYKAFLSAFVFFVIFKPLYAFLTNKWHLHKPTAAGLIIILSIFLILLPLSLLVSIIVNEVQTLAPQATAWLTAGPLSQWLPYFVDRFDVSSQLGQISSTAKDFFFGVLATISNQFINYLITYFVLYFMLVTDESQLKRELYAIVPFSRNNTIKLAQEFKKVTYATLVTSGVIAIAQGALLTIGFFIFQLPGAFLWGFVTLLASFLPILGAAIVWLPASIILLISGQPLAALLFFLWGALVVSGIDNLLRPFIQKRVGQMHPLLSLIGIVIGIALFGLIGIILGPLILSYFLLTMRMFKEEYIKPNSLK